MTLINRIDRCFIILDKVADHLPVISTVSNLALLAIKSTNDLFKAQPEGLYFQYLSQKTYLECAIKMIPVWGVLETWNQSYLMLKSFIYAETCSDEKSFKELLIESLVKKRVAFSDLPTFYKLNKNFVLEAACSGVDVSESLFFPIDSEIFEKCLFYYPERFVNLPDRLKSKLSFIADQMAKQPGILFHLSTDLFENREIIKACLEHFVKDPLRTLFEKIPYEKQRPYITEALLKAPGILELIPKKDQTFEHVKIAVENEGCCLKYASYRWQSNQELIDIACLNDAMALEFVPKTHISEKLFTSCINANPLSWQFGTSDLKADPKKRLSVILKQKNADIALFAKHDGNFEKMVIEVCKAILQKNRLDLLSIPFPYLLNELVLNEAFSSEIHNTATLSLLRRSLSAHFRLKLSYFQNGLFNRLPANLRYEVENRNNLTGSTVYLELVPDPSSEFRYSLKSTYRRLCEKSLAKQRKIHLSGKWDPAQKGAWQDCFTALFKYKPLAFGELGSKYQSFLDESPFFASAKDEALKQYFAQAKLQLSLIAGYIEKNPKDTFILEHLYRGFSACAGGLQSELSQIVSAYCQFSGNPDFPYRAAKIIHEFALRNIEAVALATYDNQNDVHNINRLKREFKAFFLDEVLKDPFESSVFHNHQILAFFSEFNTLNILNEIYSQSLDSESLQASIESYIRAQGNKFITNEVPFSNLKEVSAKAFVDFYELNQLLEEFLPFEISLRVLDLEIQKIMEPFLIIQGPDFLIAHSLKKAIKDHFKKLVKVFDRREDFIKSSRMDHENSQKLAGLAQDMQEVFIDEYFREKNPFELEITFLCKMRPLHTKIYLLIEKIKGYCLKNSDEIKSLTKSPSEDIHALICADYPIKHLQDQVNTLLDKSRDDTGKFTKDLILACLEVSGIFESINQNGEQRPKSPSGLFQVLKALFV
jgi:hypothetical protein